MRKYTALTENHLFGKVYQRGKKYVGAYCAVYVLPDYFATRLQKEHPHKIRVNRLGIAVFKKLGCAVVRNRAKRIIREAWRQTESAFGIKTGYLVVVAAREKIKSVKTAGIAGELFTALNALKMLSD